MPFIDNCLSSFAKDEHIPRLGGYIQRLESWIKGEHIRVFARDTVPDAVKGLIWEPMTT